MKSYSSQLARIHIDYYLHQLLRSIPQLNELSETAPVTGIYDGWMDGCHIRVIYILS